MSEEDLVDGNIAEELELATTITNHGRKRVRERLGLPNKAVEREIERALERGLRRQDVSGRMRRLLDHMYHRYGAYGEYVVYRGCIFVFRNHHFVTVMHLTDNLHNEKASGRSKHKRKRT